MMDNHLAPPHLASQRNSLSLATDVREGGTWSRPQRLKNNFIYVVVSIVLGIAGRLPRPVVAFLCRAAGATAYHLLRHERERARERLARGLNGVVPERRVRSAFLTVAAMLADTIALLDPNEPAARTLSIDIASRDAFHAALAEGRGVVFVSAHIGSWERMAALLVENGFPIATVARESYDPRFTRLYERIRTPRGVRSIYRGRPGAIMSIVRELAAKGTVGFLIDLPIRARVPCVRERLFGADSDIPVGAARIALARRAAVVVGTCTATAENRSTVRTVTIRRIPIDDLAPGPNGERELVSRMTRELDARIGAHPEAWIGLFTPFPSTETPR